MQPVIFLFWASLFIIFYNYIGYALLAGAWVFLKKIFLRPKPPASLGLPGVTLVVAAYNEADFIDKKIQNCRQLHYPAEKIKFIFITDGSTDDTPQIISQCPFITLMHQPGRKGKTDALNRAMKAVSTPIVIFCDANTFLNEEAVINIVKHYADPQTGGVAGEKKIMADAVSHIAGSGEGIYWKYESWLKKVDASFYSVVGAAGELFSIRTNLFQPLDENTILDDFVLSLKVAQKGYRFAYEPEAYAMEGPSASLKEERKRKVRICAGGFQAMLKLRPLLNPFKHLRLTYLYISHRVLRWTLSPLCFLVIFAANIYLIFAGAQLIYKIIFIAQLLFYGFAFAGFYFSLKNIRSNLFYIPYYFVFMNISVYLGFFRFIKGRQPATWEKAARKLI